MLLHGFTGSSDSWGRLISDGLVSVGCSPVLCDLPGHGSHSADLDPRHFSLEATLTQVEHAGVWPTALIGYSMGGRVALHFAAAHPTKVHRLILESASPGLATEAERLERQANDEALACEIELHGVKDFVRRWERLPLFESQLQLPSPVRAKRHAQRLRNTEAGLASALKGLGTGVLPSLWDVLPSIQTRTLIIVGELDTKFVEIGEQMTAVLPQAQLLIVPGAGHTVHLERPRRWVEAVAEFICST